MASVSFFTEYITFDISFETVVCWVMAAHIAIWFWSIVLLGVSLVPFPADPFLWCGSWRSLYCGHSWSHQANPGWGWAFPAWCSLCPHPDCEGDQDCLRRRYLPLFMSCAQPVIASSISWLVCEISLDINKLEEHGCCRVEWSKVVFCCVRSYTAQPIILAKPQGNESKN